MITMEYVGTIGADPHNCGNTCCDSVLKSNIVNPMWIKYVRTGVKISVRTNVCLKL